MRCPDCNRMVSFEEPVASVESEEVDDDGQVHIEVRLVLPCGECGIELKDYTFSFDHDLEHTCEEGKVKCTCGHPFSEHKPNPAGCIHIEEKKDPTGISSSIPCSCSDFIAEGVGFELEVSEPEPSDDFKPKVNSKGKPIPMRYQKHFYGVTVTGTAACNKCGEKIPFTLEDEIQSSGMDESV